MANNTVRTYEIEIGSVYNNGVLCVNPTVTVAGGKDVSVNCTDAQCGIYTVQVGPGVTDPCLIFLVQCEDCGSCPAQEIEKCFCDTIEDCGACEFCASNGFCEKLCPVEECINNQCGDCATDDDCTCNMGCFNRTCGCPAGSTWNSVTGCCDECQTDGDCDDCDLCKTIGGAKTCVAKDCGTDVVKLETCECVECNNSADCDPGERCNSNNECECKPNHIRINGICTYVPCQFDTDCGPCEYCDILTGCQPILCTGTAVCNPETNGCEEPCDNPPVGFGNLDGFCVPCNTLSCTGVISECSQAKGCGCNGNVCEWVDCSSSDCIDWVVTNPNVIPGNQVPGSGSPAPAFTASFTALGIVPMSGGGGNFLDYSITITETGGNSGTWSAEGSPLGSGSSVTFTLSQPSNIQWNNVGFEVNFVGALGQTGSIAIYNTNWFDLGNGFSQDIFTIPANWAYDVQGSAVAPTFTGGSFTPGSLKLCPCGEDSTIVGYSWTTLEGNLTLTFTPLPDGCVRATAQGCGVGQGTATIECAGTQTTLPLPSLPYDLSGSNCCDPLTDPNCNGTPGDGFGCNVLTVVNGEIALSNTNFITGDGFGLFRGVFQPDSIGYSIPQWIRAARNVCWSVTGTVREATSFIPPTLAHLFHDVEYRNGVGCLQFGKTCEVKIPGCKKVEAEACFEGCENFTVSIVDTNPLFTASTSLGNNVQVSYAWSASNGSTGTGSTFTIPTPNTTISSITVVATLNVNGTICTASDTIAFTLDAVQGCTNPNACNYNINATVDDGSCVLVAAPTYDCVGGFVPGPLSVLPQDNPVIVYKISSGSLSGTTVVPGTKLNSGTYSITVYFNGVTGCTHSLVVPVCYYCNGSNDCVAASQLAAPSVNYGTTSSSNCDGGCGCNIEITVEVICDANQNGGIIYIDATGDTGLHVASVTKQGGTTVTVGNPTFSGGRAQTGVVCDGNYTIRVVGDSCEKTHSVVVDCYDCVNTNIEFTADARYNPGNPNHQVSANGVAFFDCGSNNVNFTFVGDTCASQYRLKLINSSNVAIGSVQVVGTAGQKTIPTGPYNIFGDGSYKIQITDITNNCVVEEPIVLNCNGTIGECAITGLIMDITNTGVHLNFPITFTLDSGDGFYQIQLYSVVGGVGPSCTGGVRGSLIASNSGIAVVSGTNYFNGFIHPNISVLDVDGLCYEVVLTSMSDATCTMSYMVQNSDLPPVNNCSITINSIVPDIETGLVYINWTGVDTSNDVTVRVYVSPSGVCNTGTDPYTEIDGLGQSGYINFGPIDQLQSQDQCITVMVFDTNNPICTDSMESVVVGCTCAVEILNTVVDNTVGDEKLIVTFTSECTSGQVDLFVTGDATGGATVNGLSTPAPSEDGVIVNHVDVEIPLTGYPPVGGTIDLELTDNVDGGCTHTVLNIILPSNCVACSQVASFYLNDSVVTEVRDTAANLIATGSYDMTTDTVALEAAIEAGIITQGGNFCLAGDPVDVEAPRESGTSVNQDNSAPVTLDYALITHPSAWVGTKKTYFGDCGCGIARTCDYTVALPISATANAVTFYYGTSNLGSGFTSKIEWTGFSQTPSGSLLTQMQNDILNALTTLSGCAFTVGSVSVTYDTGTDVLTIVINDTDAAVGVIFAAQIGIGITAVGDFTQSGCV